LLDIPQPTLVSKFVLVPIESEIHQEEGPIEVAMVILDGSIAVYRIG